MEDLQILKSILIKLDMLDEMKQSMEEMKQGMDEMKQDIKDIKKQQEITDRKINNIVDEVSYGFKKTGELYGKTSILTNEVKNIDKKLDKVIEQNNLKV